MIKLAIHSIEFENCLKSNKDDLNCLEKCHNCGKLPLPSFRSKTEPEKCFCNECYSSLNLKTENLITYHIKSESMILERLIFSCKNHKEGCEKVFKRSELDQLLIHQDNCDKKLTNIAYKNCEICKSSILEEQVHNCLLNYISDNDVRLNKIIEMFNKKIETIQETARKQQISFEEKLNQSHDLIKSQSIRILTLEEKVESNHKCLESQPKQIHDLEVQLNNTFNNYKKSINLKFEQQTISLQNKFKSQQNESKLQSNISSTDKNLNKENNLEENKNQIIDEKVSLITSNLKLFFSIIKLKIKNKQSIIDQLRNDNTQITIDDFDDFIIISPILSKLTHITKLTLDLRNHNHYNSEKRKGSEFQKIKDPLSKMSHITQLTLIITCFGIEDSGLKELSASLSKLTQITKLTLNLRDNKIGDSGIRKLSETLSKLTQITQLNLNLRNNLIEDSGLMDLSTSLSKLTLITDLTLDLRETKIGDSGLIELSTSLSKLTHISELKLGLYENEIEDSGINQLYESLSKLTQITKLILSFANKFSKLDIYSDKPSKSDIVISSSPIKKDSFSYPNDE